MQDDREFERQQRKAMLMVALVCIALLGASMALVSVGFLRASIAEIQRAH